MLGSAGIMRALATLAVLAAWHGAHADPAAPPLSPIQSRREDAQRLREQQRELEREREHPPAAVAPAPPRPAAGAGSSSRTVGVVLLAIAGASAATTVALYAGAPGDDDYWPEKAIGIATTAIAGILGISVMGTSHLVQVAPSVGPRTAGLAISGRL
jgi:hypothetical protein